MSVTSLSWLLLNGLRLCPEQWDRLLLAHDGEFPNTDADPTEDEHAFREQQDLEYNPKRLALILVGLRMSGIQTRSRMMVINKMIVVMTNNVHHQVHVRRGGGQRLLSRQGTHLHGLQLFHFHDGTKTR